MQQARLRKGLFMLLSEEIEGIEIERQLYAACSVELEEYLGIWI
jgi:hypothetical protein